MNAKKAKALRRMATKMGHFKLEPEYKVKETKKVVYYTDKEGNSQSTIVSRFTVMNTSRVVYRRIKQAYKNGELSV